MKHALRALSGAIYILWLIVIVFTITAVYSASQLGVDFNDQPRTSTSGAIMTLQLPFSMDNKGLYDISDLNLTTILKDNNGTLVSKSSTVVRLISSGNRVDTTHNISISLENMTSTSLSRLLFYDADLDADMSLALKYARVIPLEISTNIKNFTQWGAPLYNLAVGNVAVEPHNTTLERAILPLSFENHSFFTLNGTVRTEIINTLNQVVGGATTPINATPQRSYVIPLVVLVSAGYGSFKEARLYFDNSVFSYGPVVMPIG